MKNLSVIFSEETAGIEVLEQKDSAYAAQFSVTGAVGNRQFILQTNAPLEQRLSGDQRQIYRDYLVNPRMITESDDYPTVQSNQAWFDALYALATEEVRQCSVVTVRDGAYNDGQSMPNPAEGGYFQTGLFWTYIWTRDISYAVYLSLATLDPIRALNSVRFKLSERRQGGNLQIIQDTGTGGSYPMSCDRTVWSFGCEALLPQLQGDTRQTFIQQAFDALRNTIAHDRQVVFDPTDGLYQGEQSFLDWREQTYPAWTATDPVQIGMSKALSTNCCHYNALQQAARLAGELGDVTAQQQYQQWAEDLRSAIRTHLYLPDQTLFSTFITTPFAPGAAHQYDLLGNALAILLDIADPHQAAQIVAHYPHLPNGAPVIWPQQRDTLIYHNHAIWPFVTALWLKAARKVGNDQAVSLAISSLVRGAALSLSNMENFDVVSGRVEIDSEQKEPQVNSPRQLWSVAGYVSMVHDVLFGLTWTDTGGAISPYITREIRNDLLVNTNQLTLSGLIYRGHQLDLTVHLPPVTTEMAGAYTVSEIRLNGSGVTGEIAASMLRDRNTIEVDLVDRDRQQSPIRLVSDLADYRQRFAPRPPVVENITVVDQQLEVQYSLNDENPDEITVNVYRDGQLVASDLPGNLTRWRDPNSAGVQSPSYCYNLEAVYRVSGTTSQRSQPFCYWGPSCDRIYTVNADQFQVEGGNFSSSHGRDHYDNWGAPGDTITATVQAHHSGRHTIQVVAGNGTGAINTGITCAVKHLQMRNVQTHQIVAAGYLKMPQLGNWERWLESSVIYTTVDLVVGQTYEVTIDENTQAINMSYFSHNETYTGGTGGTTGAANYVNIAQIKFNALDPV